MQTRIDPQALFNAAIAEVAVPLSWEHGDDLCDCTFQRIGEWTNPYLGATLQVRMCCIWAKLYEQFPEYVQVVDAFHYEDKWIAEPQPWDGDGEMPTHIWHRHLARTTGKPLAEIRAETAAGLHERPRND